MRVIIQENKELLAKWAARHVAERINNAHPTSEKPFVLGLPTGSTPLGMYPVSYTHLDVYKRQG